MDSIGGGINNINKVQYEEFIENNGINAHDNFPNQC